MATEKLFHDTEQFLVAMRAPISPRVFHDSVRNLEAQAAQISDKVTGDKISSALAPVRRCNYVDPDNWLLVRSIIVPRIETLLTVIRQKSDYIYAGERSVTVRSSLTPSNR